MKMREKFWEWNAKAIASVIFMPIDIAILFGWIWFVKHECPSLEQWKIFYVALALWISSRPS